MWGSGGHGRVVGDLVRAAGHEVVGYVDSDPGKLGRIVEPDGTTVSHLQDQLVRAIREGGRYPNGVDASALGLGDNQVRLQCLQNLEGLAVPPLVHPSATVSPTASLGRGSVIFPQAVVNTGAQVGDAVIVNSGAVVEHDCVLGSGVHVSPGATLCGGVRVGERSWIGAGATVIQGLTIGTGSTVGAGSTVIRDVGDDITVVGRPARSIHSWRHDE